MPVALQQANWTEGRNLSRLHPGLSAAQYVMDRVGTLPKSVVPVLLEQTNWSNRQIAAVAGVSEGAVRLEVRRNTHLADEPRPVLGADNKLYAPRTPKPAPAPEPEPAPEPTPTVVVVAPEPED